MHPRFRINQMKLQKALDEAVEEALWRVQHGPRLPGALADAARQVLRSGGVEGAQVSVEQAQDGGWVVNVRLPASAPLIEQVRVRVGPL
jgi:hypothetical protein